MCSVRHLRDYHGSGAAATSNWSLYISLPFIIVPAVFATIVTSKPRRQRREVAQKLEQFDVEETQAFNPSDKDFVLEEIKEWNSSYDEFNRKVKTKVATRLDRLQRRREVEEASVVFLLILPFIAPVIIGLHMATGDLEPLIWPSMWSDIGAFIETDDCYCPWLVSENNWNEPPSNNSCAEYYAAAGGGDGVSTNSGCFFRWNAGAFALLASVALGCLVCLIGTCCCALRWAARATANPS